MSKRINDTLFESWDVGSESDEGNKVNWVKETRSHKNILIYDKGFVTEYENVRSFSENLGEYSSFALP